jgi:hypothetical protein
MCSRVCWFDAIDPQTVLFVQNVHSVDAMLFLTFLLFIIITIQASISASGPNYISCSLEFAIRVLQFVYFVAPFHILGFLQILATVHSDKPEILWSRLSFWAWLVSYHSDHRATVLTTVV